MGYQHPHDTRKEAARKKPASTKNKIRSLQRLLKKTEDAEAKQGLRRQIRELEKTMKSNLDRERERKYAVRYHKIKFFERQKLRRRLKQALRQIEGLGPDAPAEERQRLEARAEELRMDFVYVDFYPRGSKYYSLFGRSQGEDDARTVALRDEMREQALRAWREAGSPAVGVDGVERGGGGTRERRAEAHKTGPGPGTWTGTAETGAETGTGTTFSCEGAAGAQGAARDTSTRDAGHGRDARDTRDAGDTITAFISLSVRRHRSAEGRCSSEVVQRCALSGYAAYAAWPSSSLILGAR